MPNLHCFFFLNIIHNWKLTSLLKRRKEDTDSELRTTDAIIVGLDCFFFLNIILCRVVSWKLTGFLKKRKKKGRKEDIDSELRTTDAVACFFFVNIIYNTMYYVELLIGN